ncbi:hypothetical protein U9M48_001831 [Paspalum notatum var. saurae]|uniref:Uncharacterized protein n=1 Tax=Paspalum notatum var. saurae TaxID=547442 RepID=A0AAQ3PFB0_PASNO
MIERGLAPNTDTYPTLIDGYGRGGKKDTAIIAVLLLDRQHAQMSDALVRKLTAVDNFEAASLFLKSVLDKHYVVDHETYTSC